MNEGQPSRDALLARLERAPTLDLVVIGGGATGLGVALDAAARGLSVALVEAEDFAKGTSSRATKLVHGGVRYLAQGNVALVREALRERAHLLRNAPHLVQPLAFVLPLYGARGRWFDSWFYGAGLMLYDLLGGGGRLGRTAFLGSRTALASVPGLRSDGLAGALQYWDGQFDDARLAVALARTAIARGALVVNHCAAVGLTHDGAGKVNGVVAEDRAGGRQYRIGARCVVNAAGVWVDTVRRMDRADCSDSLAPSQGVHIVVDRDFLPSERAVLVPKTADGRVLFAVPWLGKTILGTTDTPRSDLAAEPEPFDEEVRFILGEAAGILARAPTRADVRSVWVGLRPLVKPPDEDPGDTKALSREHAVLVERSGLVTVTGGKWTTYRAMAEDVLQHAMAGGLLPPRAAGATAALQVVGAPAKSGKALSEAPGLHLYGTEADIVQTLPGAERELAPGLSEAMVRFAVRHEYARSVEDVLARRSRLLFLDARLAAEVGPRVATLLAEEMRGPFDATRSLRDFAHLAARYASVE
ncbi:MAG: glycerol-3-phosphate dehydrogenase/oxidase [Betaproteobacteria bacterium]|nr:glycerol-3-phosphate dehydrogenase/oxidase [Betaproteobacteria bacterium]MDH4323335.1 glycerol-3-phosphate dehydrogenase/oxidase [Betaproteobacteria bacterium]MDH5577531.1 glycerol-3-phosphate dehydrogenase/oxidase [Betaproteobacteria bacterium]